MLPKAVTPPAWAADKWDRGVQLQAGACCVANGFLGPNEATELPRGHWPPPTGPGLHVEAGRL